MGSVTLIANPAAGRRRAAEALAVAEQVLRAAGREVRTYLTTGPDHAASLAQEHAPRSDLLVAVGGDGTLSDVLAGALRWRGSSPGGAELPPLAILPAGTGNDFAATVGTPTEPWQAAQALLAGVAHPLDYGRLIPAKVPFANIVGCGFDARVAAWLNRGRRLLPGRAAYLQGVARELATLRSMPARVEVDDQVLEGDFLLVAIANAQSYGCGMRIAPQARLTDGLLDVVVVDRLSRLRFIRQFRLVFRGHHLGLPEVHLLRGAHVRLTTAEPAPVLVDGDVRTETPLEAVVEPGGMPFWLPPGSPVLRDLDVTP